MRMSPGVGAERRTKGTPLVATRQRFVEGVLLFPAAGGDAHAEEQETEDHQKCGSTDRSRRSRSSAGNPTP